MSSLGTGIRVGGFVLAVGAVFAGAYGIGTAVGPAEVAAPPEMEHSEGSEPAGHGEEKGLPAAGLLISDRGYTLKVLTTGLSAGVGQDFGFQVVDGHGEPLTEFQIKDDKPMHLIVARRDLSGFQHVHPELDATGTWHVPLSFAEAGEYRVFADFLPQGADEDLTLGADVPVAGDFRPRPLPLPADTATVDGYEVHLEGDLTAGATRKLTLSVHKDGRPVTDLQPYLGSFGHLVVLRAGDLAYLHVHPDEATTGPDRAITFLVEVPSAGDYRLYLNFQHQNVVRTAEFTATVRGQ